MSVTVLGDPEQRNEEVEAKVRLQLARWLDRDVGGWKLLRIYRIPNAHPVLMLDTIVERPVRLENGIFVCGDHRFMASIQAALLNGRHAAEAVAAHVA